MIEENDILIRKIKADDAVQLSRWLSDPTVLTFYEGRGNPFTIEKVKKKFFSADESIIRCIVEYNGKAIGYVQMYEVERDLSIKRFGMDQFIGESSYWNKGIGTLFISKITTHMTDQFGARVIQVDPQVTNLRAIRCYEKCGFQKVRVLPKHEFHEGAYRGCWLMEYRS